MTIEGVEPRICHMSLANPELMVYCYEGMPGTIRKAFEREYYCSAWDKDLGICIACRKTISTELSE